MHVKLLAFWRWLGFQFLVNQFPRYRRFWEHYLCYVVRGKVMEFEFEVLKMIGLLYRAADRMRRRRYAENHGRIGEDLAHRFLRARGCTVVARNYRTLSGSGEIDLVVWDGGKLAFVEVKTRSSDEFGPPESAVDAEKRERVERAARDYARRAEIPWRGHALRYRQHRARPAAPHRMAARRVLISLGPPAGKLESIHSEEHI